MANDWYRRRVETLAEQAGVRINGDRPFDIKVHDPRLYRRVIGGGSLALGEAYMDGWWDCDRLDEFFHRALSAHLDEKVHGLDDYWQILKAWLINVQSPSRAYRIGKAHYDKGNDLYRTMLDRRMVYTCAYWKDATNLDEAQEAKLDLVCRKLGLQKGMRVLDIGCGWGSAAKFAAERYGVSVLGVTVSRQQVELAREVCRGLPVEIELLDYRRVEGQFDRILSLGMFEHVGYKNYATFMEVVRKHLVPDGLFLLHTIGRNDSSNHTDPWIERYIFPNSMLPSAAQISEAIEGRFILEDWHNFGADYDRTLMAWYENFRNGWDGLREKYGDRFYRMWSYFLMVSAGGFRARSNQLWQLVLSPRGLPGGYRAPR
ncbi:MAG: cyclopropane fatty acyl phospholipid synthase [Gammaproteobacteria bacterium]|jgi:cyclopropane-fatty-acyl-phospholipid synthase